MASYHEPSHTFKQTPNPDQMSRRSNTNMFALLEDNAPAAPSTPIKNHTAPPVPNAPARPSSLRRVAYGWTPPPVAKPVIDPLADFPVLAGSHAPKQQTPSLNAWASVASTKPQSPLPKKNFLPGSVCRQPVLPRGLPSYQELFPSRCAPLPEHPEHLEHPDLEDSESSDDDGWN